MITIILVDDHALVRQGLRYLFQNTEIQIIGESGSGIEAIQLVRSLRPDVVLLDFRLPDISGLEVTTRLLRLEPDAKILILSSAIHDLFPFRLLEAGAQGYLTKDATKDELVQGIKKVYSGQHIISPEVASRLALAKIDLKKDSFFQSLSHREMEVMMMIIRGDLIKDISDRLFLSPKTVHSYRSRIFEKMGVENDVELTLLAIRKGIISMEETGV